MLTGKPKFLKEYGNPVANFSIGENMKVKYIYLTTNQIDNKKYIGQHYGELEDTYLGSGIHFLNALRKYGKEHFKKEILEICDTQEELDKAEQKWIKYYNAAKSDEFYNIAEGGRGGNPVMGLTPEQELLRRERISKALQGENNPMYQKGFHGKEHPMYGKHHSEEAKEKMRQAKIGKSLSEEHKRKISESNKTKRKILCYDLKDKLIGEFESLRAVNLFLGLSPKSTYRLREAMKANKPYHNYIFKDAEEAVSTILGSEE